MQDTYVNASNTGMDDFFGHSVRLSRDGGAVAVGAPFEASEAVGLDGDATRDAVGNAGAAYVFDPRERRKACRAMVLR